MSWNRQVSPVHVSLLVLVSHAVLLVCTLVSSGQTSSRACMTFDVEGSIDSQNRASCMTSYNTPALTMHYVLQNGWNASKPASSVHRSLLSIILLDHRHLYTRRCSYYSTVYSILHHPRSSISLHHTSVCILTRHRSTHDRLSSCTK